MAAMNNIRLVMNEERVLNTYDTNSDFSQSSLGRWNLQKYTDNISVVITDEQDDGNTLEFDMINVEAPIANAIRRVPTMAIEKVYMYQNTSLVQDEVLCHRLGLLPINADPRLFQMPLTKFSAINEDGVDCDEEPVGNAQRNLIFELKVKCTKNASAPKIATDPKDLYVNSSVYSGDLTWIPIGSQENELTPAPSMMHDDILIAKLRPNQEIELRCHCVKGIGRDHAKFSPVATATYRLLPIITLKAPVIGEAAHRLKASFSTGVISIKTNRNGEEEAVVHDARRDLCSRNVLRHSDLAQIVELSRKRDHFLFCVESTGALRSADLVIEACKVIECKARDLHGLFSLALQTRRLI